MKSQTILVTGGAGYIGSFSVKALLDDDYDVIVFDSLENGHREAVDPRATLVVGNLKDCVALDQVFQQYQPDAVIDFAAYLQVGESMLEPEKYLANNVYNFVNLLEATKRSQCRYLIKSSTASVYGNPEEKFLPLQEDYQVEFRPKESALLDGQWEGQRATGDSFLQLIIQDYQAKYSDRPELILTPDEIAILRIPASVYGLTKLLDEILMKKYEKISGLKTVALRYFNAAGAADDGSMGDDRKEPSHLITIACYSLLGRAESLKIYGADYPTPDGTGVRDYVHTIDLADGHLAALKYLEDGNESSTFNLGTGRGNSVFEVLKAIEAVSGQSVQYQIVDRRPGDVAAIYADATKANESLNWQAKRDLKNMVETAWRWYSTHPRGYN